ncbi:YoaK family protein [Rhodanobacter sp. MP1X3]|uniref:DUF1275 family protein n=1 Tax=Rhodanobacter sp. MP1X3 TaxID=2723086 RepID=UPI00161742DE|nr:uncharacterized membrane protein YoaK (UPF0700 family) [Rhodanobacter sp. MP1X3]
MKTSIQALVRKLRARRGAAVLNPGETIGVAMLLSGAGGFLDAFTWLGHGGVFANAQSGNVVLLGIYAASGQWDKSLRHVPPIVAFFVGVFVAFRLRAHESRSARQRSALLSLSIEIVFLLVVAALPRNFPDIPIVLGVAFVAALQSTSFAKVEGSPYSSVMTTGNLRRTAELLFAGIFPPRDAVALHQSRIFMMVCSSFAMGACAGGLATAKLGNLSVLLPALALLLALVRCIDKRRDESSG